MMGGKSEDCVWFVRVWDLGVLSTCFLGMSLSSGAAVSMSVLVVEFLDYFRESKFATSWCVSLTATVHLTTGPLWMAILSRISHRHAFWLGVAVSTGGLLSSAFATKIYHLYITLGIITGIGYGIVNYVSVIYASEYFTKHRDLAVGIVITGAGAANVVMPYILKKLVNAYAWRGALVIMAAIMAQQAVFSNFMTNIQPSHADLRKYSSKSNIDYINDNDDEAKTPTAISELSKDDVINEESYSTQNNLIYLLRSWRFQVLWFIFMQWTFCNSIFLTFNMDFFIYSGIDKSASVILLLLGGIGNMFGRVTSTIAGYFMNKRKAMILSIGLLISLVSMSSPFTPSPSFALYSALSFGAGMSFGCIGPAMPIVVFELFGIFRIREAFALVQLSYGIGACLGPPIGGLVFDLTQDYHAVFLICIGLSSFSIAATVPIICVRL